MKMIFVTATCGALLLGQVAFAGFTSTSFADVVQAYRVMLLGKTLNCDDGAAVIKFSSARYSGDGRYVANYTISFMSGNSSSGVESVQNTSSGIYVDQIVAGVTTRHNIATIEEPYHVFRVRPVNPQATDFIVRDCIRRSENEGTICYIKVRYMNDVIVSECRETKRFSPTR